MGYDKRSNPYLPSRLFACLAWLWLLIGLPFFTDATCHFPAFLFLGGTGFLLAIMWAAFTVAWPALLRSPNRKYWLSIPLAGALGLLLLQTDWDLTLRIWLSERALSDYVAKTPPESNDRIPRW